MKDGSPPTQSNGMLAAFAMLGSIQTVPRLAAQCVIRCKTPRRGTASPAAKGICSGNRRSFVPIQAACLAAKDFASFRLPRADIVSTTSCVAVRTRNVNRRAEESRRKLIR
jgi:hypothetical protein